MRPLKLLSFSVMILAILCLAPADPAQDIPKIAKFKLDLISGSEGDPTGGWWSITGGEANLEWADIEGLDPYEKPNGQLWTFKLVTSGQEVPPGLPEIPNYETTTFDLEGAPTLPSIAALIDPLLQYVYYPTEVDLPGDGVRFYVGIVLEEYKIDPGEEPGEEPSIYVTCLITNNVSIIEDDVLGVVLTIDVGAGPIGLGLYENPAHIVQTVLDEIIMVQGVSPDDNCDLGCDENRKDCRKRVRMERKKCRAKCRLDPEPRPCLRDCLITAREAMRQCRREAAQICAESCTLSLKQVEGIYLDGKKEPITALSSKAFFNIDTSKLFDKTIIDALERKGQVEVNYPALLGFEDSKTFVLERELVPDSDSDWAEWYKEPTPKKLSLFYIDAAGNERTIVGWALPIGYDADQTPGVMKETINLIVEKVVYK